MAVGWLPCLLLAAAPLTCSTQMSGPVFFGKYVGYPNDNQTASSTAQRDAGRRVPDSRSMRSGDIVVAEGSVASKMGRQWISANFTNYGMSPVRFSYMLDEYVAKTFQERIVALEKGDFIAYPDVLNPREEKPVTLLIPEGTSIDDITHIVAKIHNGSIIGSIIMSMERIGPVVARTDTVVVKPVAPPEETPQALPAAVSESPVPVVSRPAGAPAGVSALPLGTVPVEVEFRQDLGSALNVRLQWNTSGQAVTLAKGDRQMYYVAPGEHELHLVSRLPSLTETRVHLPITVEPKRRVRVVVSGEAHLDGVELRVQIWRDATPVFDRRFGPPD